MGPFKAFLQVSEGLLVKPVYCLCTCTSAKLYYLLRSSLHGLCVLMCYWPIFLRQSDGIVCQQQKSVRGLHHLWSAEALGWLMWVLSRIAAVTGAPGELSQSSSAQIQWCLKWWQHARTSPNTPERLQFKAFEYSERLEELLQLVNSPSGTSLSF